MSITNLIADDKYNRKLFLRVIRGAYIFNPTLALKIEGEWINIYDLLSIDKLAPEHQEVKSWWFGDYNEQIEQQMAANKIKLKQLISEHQQGRSGVTHEQQ